MTPDGEPGGTRPDGAPAGPAAAEIYLRLIAETELRQQPVISGPGPHPHRVWLAAATLAAAGALGPDVAWARVALAGLRSSAGGATLHVMSSGWEPRGHGWLVHGSGPGDIPPGLPLSWRARDSTGRWHLVSGMSWGAASQARGMIKMYLTPPLHPAATALDVFVTGPHHQVRATVPLRWAGGATRGGQPGVPGGLPNSPPATGPGQ
jgi:hypothetical protein